MGYKDGIYWRDAQDEQMRILLTNKDSSIWTKTYYKLLPRLKKMSYSILRKFYGAIEDKKADDLVIDAISHLLINGTYDESKPKLFSYCGTIIKRFFYTELVIPNESKYDVVSIDDESINTISYEPDFDDFDMDERIDILNKINTMIDVNISRCDGIIERSKKTSYDPKFGATRERDFLLAAKEFWNKFFLYTNISSLVLGEYIQHKLDIPDYVLGDYMRRHFNVGTQPRYMDSNKNIVDWLERFNSSYVMDDYTPKDISSQRYLRNRKKNSEYEYF
jgi:hypothetical protein